MVLVFWSRDDEEYLGHVGAEVCLDDVGNDQVIVVQLVVEDFINEELAVGCFEVGVRSIEYLLPRLWMVNVDRHIVSVDSTKSAPIAKEHDAVLHLLVVALQQLTVASTSSAAFFGHRMSRGPSWALLQCSRKLLSCAYFVGEPI